MQIYTNVASSFVFYATSLYRQAKVNFMPTGRKLSASKTTGSSVKTQSDSRSNLRNGHSPIESPSTISAGVSTSLLTKAPIYHQPCPMTPVFTAIGFEVFYLFYGLLALFSQYVNIYKTNYHLIDYQEVLVIALFLMRRIGWIVFTQVVYIKGITSLRIVLIALLKGLGLVGLLACFIWLILQLYRTMSVTNILLFLYPTMTYLWVFGFTMELKLQRVMPKVTHQVSQPSKKYAPKDPSKPSNIDGEACPKMTHCTLSPDVVRYEAEGHRADFNFKMKRALFQSFICAYYVGFIPMRFSKRFYVYYDLWWSCQHVVFVWIGSLVLLMKYLAPLPYCDTLNKCAVHLGCWEECDEDEEVPDNPRDWSALTSWPQDVIVNYKNKGLYRSLGIQNVADPGDTHHWRFYFVFQSPARLTNWLLGTLCILIIYQLVMLCKSPLWHEVVSLSLPLLFNYVILGKLLRDRWVAMALELKPT